MFSIENLTNAFVSIDCDGTALVVDPWVTDGAYDGAWHIRPRLTRHAGVLADADACIITHVHADHFDPAALAMLSDSTEIFVPDLYPNRRVVDRRLAPDLRARVRFFAPGERFAVGSSTVEFVPPMNRYGHRVELYGQSDDAVAAIDAGVIVEDSRGTRAVLLADNFPYNITSAGPTLERMIGCAVLMFPYNAAADDYPLCHDSMTLEQKRAKALARNHSRVDILRDAFARLKPTIAIPYSSDFMLAGPRAVEFVKVHTRLFLDKDRVSQLIRTEAGVACTALHEGDIMRVSDAASIDVDRDSPRELFDFEGEASKLSTIDTARHDAPVDDGTLWSKFGDASAHMVKRMRSMGLESTWRFELEITDTGTVMGVALATGETYRSVSATIAGRTVRCKIPSGHAHSLLTFGSHWDNAMIACSLSWHRIPDEYDVGLYKALNYLHVPAKATA